MNRLFMFFLLSLSVLTLFGCTPDDDMQRKILDAERAKAKASLQAAVDAKAPELVPDLFKNAKDLYDEAELAYSQGRWLDAQNALDKFYPAAEKARIEALKAQAKASKAEKVEKTEKVEKVVTVNVDGETVKAKTYHVKRHDSLWRISGRVLNDSWKWRKFYKLNQDQIKNPSLIYPGQVFLIPQEKVEATR